ncbi:MAG: polysaccharide biosynthesis protein [Gammaproteobacteria bacterium]
MDLTNVRGLDALSASLKALPRKVKRLLIILADMVMMPIAFWCATVIKYETLVPEVLSPGWILLLTSLVALPVFAYLGLHRMIIRFVSATTLKTIFLAVAIAVIGFGLITNFAFGAQLTWSLLSLYGVFASIYLAGSRFVVRTLMRASGRSTDRVAIYGAGHAGAQLANALLSGDEFYPVAFFDENTSLHGSAINGLKVLSPEDLPEAVASLRLDKVLLALPSVSRRRRQDIIASLEYLPVHVKVIPELTDLVSGATQIDELRDVEVNDLLDREAVPPNESLLSRCIENKVVMVTGAGGSIGSELCRQIVNQNPRKVLLYENSELALYNIDQELKRVKQEADGQFEIVSLLGCVRDKMYLTDVMSTFGVNTVYHAAAFKHVPMVESNVVPGILNNVLGTYHCALAAIASRVDSFVLVSTDKAVNPTNVMGATKRMAEIVLQGLDEREEKTRFSIVRFGNVLASSGSVVILFRRQIEQGGPVTVTHPEIIRYFMTIPEAAQLVIQAGSMGLGGDVFLLDMGKPVKIDDLAKRMVHLMGRTVMDEENPDGDIEIKYTGLRPAEKLYEELLIGNRVMGTEHPKIMRAQEKSLPWSEIENLLQRIKSSSVTFDVEAMLGILKDAVSEYSRDKIIADQVWQRRRIREVAAGVTPISSVKRKS